MTAPVKSIYVTPELIERFRVYISRRSENCSGKSLWKFFAARKGELNQLVVTRYLEELQKPGLNNEEDSEWSSLVAILMKMSPSQREKIRRACSDLLQREQVERAPNKIAALAS